MAKAVAVAATAAPNAPGIRIIRQYKTENRCNGMFRLTRAQMKYLHVIYKSAVADYFSFIYADYPDILKTNDIAEMTEFSTNTVLRMLKTGQIKSIFTGGKYMIPKIYLLDYVKTRCFIEARCSSENYIKILGGFEIWKTAKL